MKKQNKDLLTAFLILIGVVLVLVLVKVVFKIGG
jgi:hypothetical protein